MIDLGFNFITTRLQSFWPQSITYILTVHYNFPENNNMSDLYRSALQSRISKLPPLPSTEDEESGDSIGALPTIGSLSTQVSFLFICYHGELILSPTYPRNFPLSTALRHVLVDRTLLSLRSPPRTTSTKPRKSLSLNLDSISVYIILRPSMLMARSLSATMARGGLPSLLHVLPSKSPY